MEPRERHKIVLEGEPEAKKTRKRVWGFRKRLIFLCWFASVNLKLLFFREAISGT